MEIFSDSYAKLALQNALLTTTTKELRAVIIIVNKNIKSFYIRFYHDGQVSESILDLWDCVITEASCDLGIDCRLDDNIERLDYPAEIPLQGSLVYLRKEAQMNPAILKQIKEFKLPSREKDVSDVNLKLALQNALLGKITPNIRKIGINYSDSHISVYYYFDGKISKNDADNMNDIMNVFCPYFPSFFIYLRHYSIHAPKVLPENAIGIYARYEREIDNTAFHVPNKD